MLNRLTSLSMSTSVLKALPGKLDRERSGRVLDSRLRGPGLSLTGITALCP